MSQPGDDPVGKGFGAASPNRSRNPGTKTVLTMPPRTARAKLSIHGSKTLLFWIWVVFPQFGFGFLSLAGVADAATYWLSPTGTATWTNCKSPVDPGSNYCSFSTANTNATAADIVYFKGGTYSIVGLYAEALAPVNSGTATNKITFSAAPGENPEIMGTAGVRQWGLTISGNSYIKIDGLKFSDFSDMALIHSNAHHIEVANCTFTEGGSFQMVESCMGGSDFTCYVHDIWVHNNIFSGLSAGGGCSGGSISEGGDAVRVGYPNGSCGTVGNPATRTTGANHHITIEDNVLGGAGHALLDTYGTQLVIKNNMFHNEPWYPENNQGCSASWPATGYTNQAYDNKYGHRNWQMSDDFGRDGTWNLAEGNRSGHASVNPNNDGADNFDLASSKNIVRYNDKDCIRSGAKRNSGYNRLD